ncbi:MAG: carboxypeptidase regulatory-like domain-containing protein [Planctomycetota bacterium]|nr:MAG: carboxypeptidase regulatory-like domain-containing protein [Planctomycetota bacterium]
MTGPPGRPAADGGSLHQATDLATETLIDMRPLIVLVLVVAALAAFYFAFQAGSGSEQPEPDISEPTVTAPDTSTQAPDPVALLGPSSPGARDIVDVDSLVEARAPVNATDDFDNRLTGTVENEAGEPVADAQVVLTRIGQTTFHFADQLTDRSGDISTKTNKRGEFSFKNVTPFNGYALKVRHSEYGPVEVGQVRVAASGESREPPIVLSPGTRVSGMIRDAGGAPVSGADIHLGMTVLGAAVDGPDTIKTSSTEDGAYVFENVGPGNYQMTVIADGYGRVSIQQIHISGEDIEQEVILQVAMMIAGRVMEVGNQAIEGAIVQAFSMTNRKEQTRTQTKTNEMGEFTIMDVPAGSYTLMTIAEGYKSDRKQRVETGTMDVLIDLSPQAKITGTVVDAATGAPLTKYKVRLREQVQNMQTTIPIGKSTQAGNENGTYVIFAPKPGTYIVEANSAEYAGCFSDPFTIADASGGAQGIVVQMTTGGSIRGTIVDADGKPIARAQITSHANDWTDDEFMRAIADMYPTNATTRKVRSGKDGTFVLTGLTPDTYLIDVAHGNFSKSSQRNISVTEGSETDIGKISLSSGATIRGTVYDPAGQPLAGAIVTMNSQSTAAALQLPENYTTKTDAGGKYEIQHVRSGGYSIKARRTSKAGASPFLHWEDMKATERPIVVAENQEYNGQDFLLGAIGDR